MKRPTSVALIADDYPSVRRYIEQLEAKVAEFEKYRVQLVDPNRSNVRICRPSHPDDDNVGLPRDSEVGFAIGGDQITVRHARKSNHQDPSGEALIVHWSGITSRGRFVVQPAYSNGVYLRIVRMR